jgi:antitoxin MazE
MSEVQKWGNSLAVRIPKAIAEQVNLQRGTPIDLETSCGLPTIHSERGHKQTLAALLSRAKDPSPHRALNANGPVGRELL